MHFNALEISLHIDDWLSSSAKKGFIAFIVKIFMQENCADTEDMSITLKPPIKRFHV